MFTRSLFGIVTAALCSFGAMQVLYAGHQESCFNSIQDGLVRAEDLIARNYYESAVRLLYRLRGITSQATDERVRIDLMIASAYRHTAPLQTRILENTLRENPKGDARLLAAVHALLAEYYGKRHNYTVSLDHVAAAENLAPDEWLYAWMKAWTSFNFFKDKSSRTFSRRKELLVDAQHAFEEVEAHDAKRLFEPPSATQDFALRFLQEIETHFRQRRAAFREELSESLHVMVRSQLWRFFESGREIELDTAQHFAYSLEALDHPRGSLWRLAISGIKRLGKSKPKERERILDRILVRPLLQMMEELIRAKPTHHSDVRRDGEDLWKELDRMAQDESESPLAPKKALELLFYLEHLLRESNIPAEHPLRVETQTRRLEAQLSQLPAEDVERKAPDLILELASIYKTGDAFAQHRISLFFAHYFHRLKREEEAQLWVHRNRQALDRIREEEDIPVKTLDELTQKTFQLKR